MRISGRISHCDNKVRAGHKMASSGKVGDRMRASGLTLASKCAVFFDLRRGLCGDDMAEAEAMVTVSWEEETES